MIISVSRRTDIPRFYAEWFIRRIRAGYCLVPNPYNPRQVSRVDLRPEAVTALVFWTRDPRPLLPHLHWLDTLGYRYYFLFTLTGYPIEVERNQPPLMEVIDAFTRLSDQIGAGRVLWRYDPIFFTGEMDPSFHRLNFANLSGRLRGKTGIVIVSFLSEYRKTLNNFARFKISYSGDPRKHPQLEEWMPELAAIARMNGMEVQACSESEDYSSYGIAPARCIDDRLLAREFGIDLVYKKDSSQRKGCTCTVSKDIGMNNSCLANCIYCYATISHQAAVNNHRLYDAEDPMLIRRKMNENDTH